MGSRFYFGGSDDSGSDLDVGDSALPFPKPLARSAFLTENFDAATFLSSLTNRFQSLEDLQNELRELSQSLNKDLLDLVNDNYSDFLSLGNTLNGGEEKIEELRLGLLGFQRDLSGIKSKVETRRNEVAALLDEKRSLKEEIRRGGLLLEVAGRIDSLEGQLMLDEAAGRRSSNIIPDAGSGDEKSVESASEDSDTEDAHQDGEDSFQFRKIERLTKQVLEAEVLLNRQAKSPAFAVILEQRLRRIRATLLVDIEAAKQQLVRQSQGTPENSSLRRLSQIRMSLGEG